MGKTHQQVFVLWGQGFEEVPATLFVTQLRDAGQVVKVVGVSGRYCKGRHGLALMTDLTLDQALRTAHCACCIIVPGSLLPIRRMETDPRVPELLAQACANGALFVTQMDPPDAEPPFQSVQPASLMRYDSGQDMVPFVGQVVDALRPVCS